MREIGVANTSPVVKRMGTIVPDSQKKSFYQLGTLSKRNVYFEISDDFRDYLTERIISKSGEALSSVEIHDYSYSQSFTEFSLKASIRFTDDLSLREYTSTVSSCGSAPGAGHDLFLFEFPNATLPSESTETKDSYSDYDCLTIYKDFISATDEIIVLIEQDAHGNGGKTAAPLSTFDERRSERNNPTQRNHRKIPFSGSYALHGIISYWNVHQPSWIHSNWFIRKISKNIRK